MGDYVDPGIVSATLAVGNSFVYNNGDVVSYDGVAIHAYAFGGHSTIVNEGLARWTYEGRTGYGIAEYLHQLDADGRPVVPIE